MAFSDSAVPALLLLPGLPPPDADPTAPWLRLRMRVAPRCLRRKVSSQRGTLAFSVDEWRSSVPVPPLLPPPLLLLLLLLLLPLTVPPPLLLLLLPALPLPLPLPPFGGEVAVTDEDNDEEEDDGADGAVLPVLLSGGELLFRDPAAFVPPAATLLLPPLLLMLLLPLLLPLVANSDLLHRNRPGRWSPRLLAEDVALLAPTLFPPLPLPPPPLLLVLAVAVAGAARPPFDGRRARLPDAHTRPLRGPAVAEFTLPLPLALPLASEYEVMASKSMSSSRKRGQLAGSMPEASSGGLSRVRPRRLARRAHSTRCRSWFTKPASSFPMKHQR